MSAPRPSPRLPWLFLLLGATAPVRTSAQDASAGPLGAPDARQVHWQRSLEDALALAGASGRPLLVVLNMDGESASDRIVHEEYRDPAFVAATLACVPLIASVFRHTPRDFDDEGRRIPCPRLGEVTCGEHVLLEPLLFERFLADGERVAPRHALVLPDGSKAFDLSLCFDLHDIDRALFDAVAGLGDAPPASPAEATASATWAELAGRRDHRGRARLEAALDRVQDEASLVEALDALAARGDAGSLDALRLVAARVPRLSPPLRERLVATARALGLASELGDHPRRQLALPGAVPGRPPVADRAALLPVLAELDPGSPAARSLLLACRALGESDDAVRALRLALGAEAADAVEARVQALGGPVPLEDLLRRAAEVTRAASPGDLPDVGPVTDALPEARELELRLAAMDTELRTRDDDPELHEHFAKALLDLARRRIDEGGGGIQELLEDAERNFALALEAEPGRVTWWLERARAAYFRSRFADQIEYGRRALALTAGSDEDPLAVESLRWIGDGHARLFGERSGGDPALELTGILEGLDALGRVAASRFGDGQDWASFASFLGALGLHGEEIAVALRGAERLPDAPEPRQTLNDALWTTGRIELAPFLAEEVLSSGAVTAGGLWHAGYAWILSAEDLRRREACRPALLAYERARDRFDAAAALEPAWASGCDYYVALCWLGSGLAHVRLGEREEAADHLVAAAARHAALADARDGLGYDVLDLVDKVLEWRDTGPTPVEPLELLDRLEAAAPGTAFWAAAVSDSELREALRADGRNPVRAERDSVDASGKAIRQVMGLPWPEGDGHLEASIVAGRRALARATTEEERKPLAQSLTIRAERQLELGRLEGVQESLAEAAPILGFEPPPADADETALRELAKRLRGVLGEARPRFRPGR